MGKVNGSWWNFRAKEKKKYQLRQHEPDFGSLDVGNRQQPSARSVPAYISNKMPFVHNMLEGRWNDSRYVVDYGRTPMFVWEAGQWYVSNRRMSGFMLRYDFDLTNAIEMSSDDMLRLRRHGIVGVVVQIELIKT